MNTTLKDMDVVQISKTMSEFDTACEEIDVVTSGIEGAIDTTTASQTPADQVDGLIMAVADEHALELGGMLQELEPAGPIATGQQQQQPAAQVRGRQQVATA